MEGNWKGDLMGTAPGGNGERKGIREDKVGKKKDRGQDTYRKMEGMKATWEGDLMGTAPGRDGNGEAVGEEAL